MPVKLSSKEVADRLLHYSRDNYLLLANVIKGVVLGVATPCTIAILSNLPLMWPRLAPLICSGSAAMVTYMTWGRGVLLTNARSNVRDSVLPLLMGGFEVSLFLLLWAKDDAWRPWIFALAGHTLIAVFLVRNRIAQTLEVDFDETLQQLVVNGTQRNLVKDYMTWMEKDKKGATFGTIMSLVFGFGAFAFWCTGHNFAGNITVTVAASITTIILCFVVKDADKQRREIDKFVSEVIGDRRQRTSGEGG